MKYGNLNSLLLFCMLIAVSVSCKKDPPPEPEPVPPSRVIIANRGLPANGTGSISYYNVMEKTTTHNLFYKANTYVPGNSLYSIYVDGNRTFLVMAGTGEILVVDSESMKLIRRIEGLGAPHHMIKITDSKFYVTDWQEQGIQIVNVNTGSLGTSFFTGLGPERMVKWKDYVFVANSGGAFGDSSVTMIHALEDTIVAQIRVGHNPNSLQIDKNGKLWVLCAGIEDIQNPFNSTPGALLSFDLTKDSLEYYVADSLFIQDTLIFMDNQMKPEQLTLHKNGTEMYFLDYYKEANLMKFDANNPQLPGGSFIQGDFNVVGYNPKDNEIYLANPLDETGPADVYRFGTGGGQIDLFKVGIRPSGFGFR